MTYNKFHVAKKADRTFFGIVFASKGEGLHYLSLLDQERRGMIKDIKRQVPFILQEGFVYCGKKEPPIRVTIDFSYFDIQMGCTVYCEYKGRRTPDYILRRRLFLHNNPGLVFIEVPAQKQKVKRTRPGFITSPRAPQRKRLTITESFGIIPNDEANNPI